MKEQLTGLLVGKYIFTFAILTCVMVFDAGAKPRQSEKTKNLIRTTKEHRARLPEEAVYLITKYKTTFPTLYAHIEIVRNYFEAIHDAEKTDEVIKQLAQYKGEKRELMEPSRRAAFDALRDSFNAEGERNKRAFLQQHGLFGNDLFNYELKMLEVTVDLTDTGVYRLDEVGEKSPEPFNGAKFMREKLGMEERWLQLSRDLELWIREHTGRLSNACGNTLAGAIQ